jgi:CRP-like cAMP-binding protein
MSETGNKPKTPRRSQDLTAKDRATIVRQLEFGSSLSDKTVSQFAECSAMLDVRRRRFVYRAGDQADALYAIVSGRIKLCRIEPQTDREAVIDILPEGALFGESAL